MVLSPSKISIKDSRFLHIVWSDGSESMLLIPNLRKNCPCAVCLTERTEKPSTYIPLLSSAQVTLRDIKPVGSYAIQLVWHDGHDSGIYTYDKLKEGNY
jgi:DUF971 family protein